MPGEEMTTTATQPPPAPDALTCDEEGCSEPAVFSYLWDWGATGVKCARHAATLNQTAANLSRGVVITALAHAAAPPMERAERIAAKATIMTLEAEAEDLKARGLEWYRANVELTRQVQLASLRQREFDAQIAAREEKIKGLQLKLDETEGECAELAEEVGRLRTLVQFSEQPGSGTLGSGSSPSGGGGWPPNPNPHVVDG